MLEGMIKAEMMKQRIGKESPHVADKLAKAIAAAVEKWVDIQIPLWFSQEIPKVSDTVGMPPSPAHIYTP